MMRSGGAWWWSWPWLVVVAVAWSCAWSWPCGVPRAARRAHARAQHARADADDSSPEARFSHGYRSSGRTYCDSASVTRPRAKTPIVCVTVTVAPSATAWRAVPRVPTR